jgi:hypothetical protein
VKHDLESGAGVVDVRDDDVSAVHHQVLRRVNAEVDSERIGAVRGDPTLGDERVVRRLHSHPVQAVGVVHLARVLVLVE